LHSDTDPDQQITIEAAADGWWYTCRLPEDGRLLAFFTDADLLAARFLRSGLDLLNAAHRMTSYVGTACPLEPYRRPPELRFAAANSSHLSCYGGERWVAAGDAAMAFDPLSSIGILSAVSGGQRAAEAILRQMVAGHAAIEEYAEFTKHVWQQYQRELIEQYSYELRWRDRLFWQRRLSDLSRTRAQSD
jgi:hypothetical protein